MKEELVDKLIKLVETENLVREFSITTRKSQVKKGIKFTQKILLSLDFLIINSESWVRDDEISDLVNRVVHNYTMKYNDLLGAYKRKKFQVTVGDELPNGIVKLAKSLRCEKT